MPFTSQEQRAWLEKHKPEVAAKMARDSKSNLPKFGKDKPKHKKHHLQAAAKRRMQNK